MGLTTKGYVRRNYDEILTDKINRAKELFGEDIDTSDLTPLGKFIRINAYDQAIAEEEIEAVYYARFPNTATGQSLDRLMAFVGISRNPATAAVYRVKVTGTAGHTVPAGFLVGTETGITYWTTQASEIGEDGTCLVEAVCTESGTDGNLSSSGAINRAVNADADIAAVEGVECIVVGRGEESDADLRARFAAAQAGSGSCNETAIRSAILRVPSVQFAVVISNNGDEVDSDGRPPHSFECYVLGGDDYEQEIAEAIFEKRPIGIQTVGDKAVTITDVSGNERIVRFSASKRVPVTVRMTIKIAPTFPEDGVEQVQKGISDHINGLGIGNALVLSSLYGHIYGVAGVREVTSLELSTDGGGTYSTSNISVPEFGVAVCANVLVEVDE